jgi:uncharacterized membrane protein YjjP (DUF1212 family)
MSQTVEQTHLTLLGRLARALHVYGSPSHRLEDTLSAVSDSLGLKAQYLVTPTSIIASVGSGAEARMILERVEPGDTDLGKLVELNELIRRLLAGEISAGDAAEDVDRITAAPPRYAAALTVIACTLASAMAALLFGGGLVEASLAAVIGGLIGVLSVFAGPRPRLVSVSPAIAAVVAATIPRAVLPYIDHFPFIPTLSGLIVLIPGLSLTIAMNELAHRHLVSGTARLTGAVVTFLQIGLGVAIGTKLGEPLARGLAGSQPAPLAWHWLLPALLTTALAYTVLFRARPRDAGSILAAALIAFTTARLGSESLGPEIGAAFGAFCIGVFSNLMARWRNKPSAVTLLPGLLLLVPGSIGFRSLHALLQNDVLSGIETGFAMILIAVSLVTGLFLANLVLPSRRLL